MVACISGCTQRGEHLLDGEHSSDCRGCLPRDAVEGRLCGRCWGRVQSAVRTLPGLVEHLAEVAAPGVSSPSGGSGGGGRAAGPRVLYAAALDAADDLAGMLAAWCDLVAEQRLGRSQGPRPAGLWVTDDGVVAGVRAPSAVGALAAWMEPHLAWCAGRDWAADLVADLGMVERVAARYPAEEPDRAVSGVRCPRCGAHSLVVRPARVVGGSEQVVCSELACGAVLSEEDWERARAWEVAIARAASAGGGAA